MKTSARRSYSIGSVQRCLHLLRLFVQAPGRISVYDIPQVLQFSYVYELPIGRGRHFGRQMHPVLNAIVGGWQVNGIVRIDNGVQHFQPSAF